MIFIGGISDKNIELMELNPTMCKHCRESCKMNVYKHYYFFHFFFIPLWKWKLNYYVICEDCQTIMQISNEKGEQLEQGEAVEFTLWDLEVRNEGEAPQKTCANCHEKMIKTYQYCPHCGEKI